jgi:hypothetical protein
MPAKAGGFGRESSQGLISPKAHRYLQITSMRAQLMDSK